MTAKTATAKKPAAKTTATPDKSEMRKQHKIDPLKVKAGDLMAIVYYVTVKATYNGGAKMLVEDLENQGNQFTVDGKALIEECFSADQSMEEVKVTMTKAAELLTSSYNRPLTVCFEKQGGEERVLRGRLVQPEPLLGRSHVEDLDLARNVHRLRLVDHRTIKWLVVDGLKYVVK